MRHSPEERPQWLGPNVTEEALRSGQVLEALNTEPRSFAAAEQMGHVEEEERKAALEGVSPGEWSNQAYDEEPSEEPVPREDQEQFGQGSASQASSWRGCEQHGVHRGCWGGGLAGQSQVGVSI